MTDNELINYLIDDHTIMDAALFFNCSRTTIMKRLRNFRKDPENSEILKEKLHLALLKNSLQGQKKGGSNGKKTFVLSDAEASKLKARKEAENLSYRDLERITGISYSSVRNAILRISQEETEEIGRGR